MIKRGEERVGYFIYNGLNNIIEEIVLEDYSIVNDVVSTFACMINNELGLKLTPANKEVLPFINQSLRKEDYFEKTLYKIENKDLKEKLEKLAIKTYRDEFSYDKLKEKYVKYYKNIDYKE